MVSPEVDRRVDRVGVVRLHQLTGMAVMWGGWRASPRIGGHPQAGLGFRARGTPAHWFYAFAFAAGVSGALM
jgi:hypothetical protein